MKKLIVWILAAMMLLSLAACGTQAPASTTAATEAPTTAAPTETTQAQPAGVSFTFTVVGADGAETSWELTSDAKSVGEALLAQGLIEGEDSQYGLYVTTVNGITADWDKDQTYWAFYIDGEYATTGVDATEITAGAVYSMVLTGPESGEGTDSEVTVLGEGATVFQFSVTDMEGTEARYEIHTDKQFVGEALLELGLIEGEDSQYGLYVTTVNGINADWDKDQTYWAFYINGEYAMTGVDATEITEADSYSFVLTKG